MKSQNICKFISRPSAGTLQTSRFILETELQPDRTDFVATAHRVYLIVEGDGQITLSGKTHPLSRGTMVFVMAGTVYSLQNTDGLRYMYIDFSGSRADALLMRFAITEHSPVFCGMSWLIPIWKESLLKADENNIDLLSESMLLFAFSQLGTSVKHSNAETALTDYLNEHFSDSSLTLSKAAAELGYNTKYLSHLFLQKTGVGFSDYLRELRLRQAVLLMHQGITSVKNISILCGFSDPLYFSKVFKQKFGLPPREYVLNQNPPGSPF